MSRKSRFSDSVDASRVNREMEVADVSDVERSGASTGVEQGEHIDTAMLVEQHEDVVQVHSDAAHVEPYQDAASIESHQNALTLTSFSEPEHLYYDELDTPLGTLTLVQSERGLCHIKFRSYEEAAERLTEWANRWYGVHVLEHSSERLADVTMQLKQYFAGERQEFDLPLDMRGTEFQLRVWEALCGVPYGEAVSYKHIAEKIGSPSAVRAVGGANNRNPVSIIVPCHRVIGMNGQLVGYGGGLDNKQYLLRLEGWRGLETEPVLF